MEAKLAQTFTSSLSDGELHRIEVQTLIREGLPRFDIIGLPQNVIREGRDRVVACLQRLGIQLKNLRILVSLTPAEVKKEGGHFDLAILASILMALGHLPHARPVFFWGELRLDGRVIAPRGLHAHLIFAELFQPLALYCPPFKAYQSDVPIFCVDLVEALFEKKEHPQISQSLCDISRNSSPWDSLTGSSSQFTFWAIVMLARLHVILEGPPGVGKTRWINSALDLVEPLSTSEQRERLLKIPEAAFNEDLYSVPVERPHHSASRTALLGGGSGRITAGAISRAHKGVLILDEIAEFSRDVLEGLRESLESKHIIVHRGALSRHLPADVQVLATMNPCPCGLHGSPKPCLCRTGVYEQYQARMSGPLRDRFHFIARWKYLDEKQSGEFSIQSVRARLLELRDRSKAHIHPSHIPAFQSRRKQQRWAEAFEAWLRWNEMRESTPSQLKKFKEFLEELHVHHLLEGEMHESKNSRLTT